MSSFQVIWTQETLFHAFRVFLIDFVLQKRADFNVPSDKKCFWHEWSNLISKSRNYKGLEITPSMLLIKHSSETFDRWITCVERLLCHTHWMKWRIERTLQESTKGITWLGNYACHMDQNFCSHYNLHELHVKGLMM